MEDNNQSSPSNKLQDLIKSPLTPHLLPHFPLLEDLSPVLAPTSSPPLSSEHLSRTKETHSLAQTSNPKTKVPASLQNQQLEASSTHSRPTQVELFSARTLSLKEILFLVNPTLQEGLYSELNRRNRNLWDKPLAFLGRTQVRSTNLLVLTSDSPNNSNPLACSALQQHQLLPFSNLQVHFSVSQMQANQVCSTQPLPYNHPLLSSTPQHPTTKTLPPRFLDNPLPSPTLRRYSALLLPIVLVKPQTLL